MATTLAQLKRRVAAFHGVATTALTVDTEDLFLGAANNCKSNAQLLHNFELSRVQATLSIDGANGGDLDAAVILGNVNQTLTVTSTVAAGTYIRQGAFGGYPLFTQEGAITYFLYYNAAAASYVIATTLSSAALTNFWLPATDILTPVGSYIGQGSAAGTAVVTHATSSAWSGIREVISVARSSATAVSVPLDFTSQSIALERDRYEIELEQDYDYNRRYRSDAAFPEGTGTTLVQRGRLLYIYPQDVTGGSALDVTLEGYGELADYDATSLLLSTAPDFFVQYAAPFIQWSCICELNYLFQTYVPRTEGSVTSPEKEREAAWRNLLLWDTYMVDSHTTRSR